MEEQKKIARQSWKGTGDIEENNIWYKLTENIPNTEFLGYDQNLSECSIISIILKNKQKNTLEKNDEGIIILNQTPFYGESGGQVGDIGELKNDNFVFNVKNTTKIFGNYFFHNFLLQTMLIHYHDYPYHEQIDLIAILYAHLH